MPDQATRVGGTGLLALLATYGLGRQAYGLFVPLLREEFGLTLAQLGWIGSAAQAGYLAAVVVTGLAAARTGPRAPVVVGCVAFAVGATLVAAAPGPAALAVGVVVAGASAGGTWAPFSDAVAVQVPSFGRPRALALVNAGSPAGLAVASLAVVAAGDGWRLAWAAFGTFGLAVALVNRRVLTTDRPRRPTSGDDVLGLRWFVGPRSSRLLGSVLGAALSSAAYFTFAPDTVAAAGQPRWIGAAMWATMGVVGVALGVGAGGAARRFGLRRAVAASWLCVAGSILLLALRPGSLVAALASAALFGTGFTVGYAQVALWSQTVFESRPTTGFTATIMCSAIGFTVTPAVAGALAVRTDRTTALLLAALPAALAALVPPARVDRCWAT